MTSHQKRIALLINVDAFGAHEREVKLNRLQVQHLEVQIATTCRDGRLGDAFRLFQQATVPPMSIQT